MNQNLIWIYVFKKNPESDTVTKHVIQASIAYEHLLMAWLLHCKSNSVGLGGKAVVDDSSVRAHATTWDTWKMLLILALPGATLIIVVI